MSDEQKAERSSREESGLLPKGEKSPPLNAAALASSSSGGGGSDSSSSSSSSSTNCAYKWCQQQQCHRLERHRIGKIPRPDQGLALGCTRAQESATGPWFRPHKSQGTLDSGSPLLVVIRF